MTDERPAVARHRYYFLMSLAQQRMSKSADRVCREVLGVSVVQVGVLLTLARHPDYRQRELATALGLNESAVTGLVGRMEKAGLLARRRSEADARVWELALTERATALVEQARPLLQRFNDTLSADFSDAELEVVARFLEAQIARHGDPVGEQPLAD